MSILHNPVLVLFLVLALGAALGRIRLRGAALGSAAVLFVAIAFSAFDPLMAAPEAIGTLGLALFAYAIGASSGPAFFASVRTVLDRIVLVIVGIGAAAAVCLVGGRLAGVPGPVAMGVFAGSVTNTPALAAVSTRGNIGGLATVGYSIAYPAGVIVMMVIAALALRRSKSLGAPSALITQTIAVNRENLAPIRDLRSSHRRVVFSRYEHGGTTQIINGDTRLRPGDLVVAVGDQEALDHAIQELGEPTERALHLENTVIDTRRITVSSPQVVGKRVGELGLDEKFGARITRIKRMDLDMLATDDVVLEAGDRIRVAAPHDAFGRLRGFFGHSERLSNDLNPLGLFLGLSLAVVLGSLVIPMPSGHGISIGTPAAAVLVGMVAGRLGRTGPVTWSIAPRPCGVLIELGLLLFLAVAGGKAGSMFVKALHSELGLKAFLLGLASTTLFGLIMLFGSKLLRGRPSGIYVGGMVAGAQTQPAIMGMVNDRTHFHPDATLGYVAAYPAAMLTKILIAQLLPL